MKTIAVVTGASSGMGRDFCVKLLREKELDEIWMIARRRERLEQMSEKTGGRLRAIPLDLTRSSSLEKLDLLLAAERPRIRYLVNAAGAGYPGKVDEIPYQKHGFLLDLNVKALTCITAICLPYLKRGSNIIQLCSSSAFLPQPGFASYAASKAYVLSFTRALRAELRDRGIPVTAVCPGPVKTGFFKAAGSEILPQKKPFLAESKNVVERALKDAAAGKELSVYGTSMKLVHLAGKLLPTKAVLWVMNELLTP